jgi:hypothetical protein
VTAEYVPTDAQRSLVESASAFGITQAEIATQLKISERTRAVFWGHNLAHAAYKRGPGQKGARDGMPLGGHQAMAVHKLPGGSRVIDTLGRDDGRLLLGRNFFRARRSSKCPRG